MKAFRVMLTKDQKKFIEWRAKKENRSEAEIVRIALQFLADELFDRNI